MLGHIRQTSRTTIAVNNDESINFIPCTSSTVRLKLPIQIFNEIESIAELSELGINSPDDDYAICAITDCRLMHIALR